LQPAIAQIVAPMIVQQASVTTPDANNPLLVSRSVNSITHLQKSATEKSQSSEPEKFQTTPKLR
jgi:hypothetical protein